MPCSRWKPIVKYQFFGRDGEFLKSLNIAQRQHRTVDGNPYNTVGLFKDSDSIGELLSTGLFTKKYNPLNNEWYDQIIVKGKTANQWDNVHQTFARVVEEPGIDWTFQNWDPRRPGCPECFHSHWRWGSITGGEGAGTIIGIPSGSNQDLDFAVVTNQAGEEHPQNRFSDLVNGLVQYWQPIRTFNTAGRNPLQVYRHSAPEDVVFWQSGTGYQHRDTFFAHGGFFNPALATRQLYTRSSGFGLMAGSVKAKATHEVSSSEDGLSAITAELVFSLGETTPTPFDPGLAGTFPAGYEPYNNQSYDIETTAESSGPYTVTFELPSVSDQTMFNNLRVFHIEQDPFDPTKIVWVDRTVLGPDPDQPDFANRKLSARVSTLGQLVVATLITPQPPITGGR